MSQVCSFDWDGSHHPLEDDYAIRIRIVGNQGRVRRRFGFPLRGHCRCRGIRREHRRRSRLRDNGQVGGCGALDGLQGFFDAASQPRDTSFHALMVEASVVSSLVPTAVNKDVVLEAHRYAVLGIANSSASDTYH